MKHEAVWLAAHGVTVNKAEVARKVDTWDALIARNRNKSSLELSTTPRQERLDLKPLSQWLSTHWTR